MWNKQKNSRTDFSHSWQFYWQAIDRLFLDNKLDSAKYGTFNHFRKRSDWTGLLFQFSHLSTLGSFSANMETLVLLWVSPVRGALEWCRQWRLELSVTLSRLLCLVDNAMNVIHPEMTVGAPCSTISLFPTPLHLFPHCLRIGWVNGACFFKEGWTVCS